MSETILFIVGPTASGKSTVAYELALRLKAEIISCDSMQIYKGMDIGTSKPPQDMLDDVPHHLIDIIRPDEEFNVARYKKLADKTVDEVLDRNKLPIFAGGSGLYVSVVLYGIFDEAERNDYIRERLAKEAAGKGEKYLHNKLKRIDSEAAELIKPGDSRRIIRALEVYYKTGMTISEAKKKRAGMINKYEVVLYGLRPDRSYLYERINNRVDRMFQEGLVAEVKGLMQKYNLSKTASQALGYKQIIAHLKGQYDLAEARRLIKRDTRRYAKRQLSWFNKDKRIKWIELKRKDSPGDIAERIYKDAAGNI